MSSAEWDNLVDRTPCAHIFVRFFWMHAWWQCFGDDYTLFFITAETDGRVAAFAPLMLDRQRTLRFVSDTNSDYLGFVIPSDVQTILHGFFSEIALMRQHWQIIHLRNIPAEQLSSSKLHRVCKTHSLACWKNYSEAAPYLPIKDHDQETETLLNKYSMQRPVRSMAKLGDVTFIPQASTASAAEQVDQLAVQHIARCRQVGRSSTFEDPRFSRFLNLLLANDHDRQFVQFSVLLLGEKQAACHFGFRSSGRLLWYKPSFDVSLARTSPGMVLIWHLIRFASDNSINELDFTIGDEEFKQRFTDRSRTINSFRIFPYSRLRYWIERVYWFFKNRIKSYVLDRNAVPITILKASGIK